MRCSIGPVRFGQADLQRQGGGSNTLCSGGIQVAHAMETPSLPMSFDNMEAIPQRVDACQEIFVVAHASFHEASYYRRERVEIVERDAKLFIV